MFVDEEETLHYHLEDPLIVKLRPTSNSQCYIVGRNAKEHPILMRWHNLVMSVPLGGWWRKAKITNGVAHWSFTSAWNGHVRLHHDSSPAFPLEFSVLSHEQLTYAFLILAEHYPIQTIAYNMLALNALCHDVVSRMAATKNQEGFGKSKHGQAVRLFVMSQREKLVDVHTPFLRYKAMQAEFDFGWKRVLQELGMPTTEVATAPSAPDGAH